MCHGFDLNPTETQGNPQMREVLCQSYGKQINKPRRGFQAAAEAWDDTGTAAVTGSSTVRW